VPQIVDSLTNRKAHLPRAARRITRRCRWLICAVGAIAATLSLVTGLRASQWDTGSPPGFYALLQTDKRHDHAGLSTVLVAGKDRLVFDCGLTEDDATSQQNGDAVRALFLTHLEVATTSGFERLFESAGRSVAAESPLQVWGPRGTREWMRQLHGEFPTAGSSRRRQITVVDVDEGQISENDGLTVLAIAISDGHFAYRVAYKGRSVLIATDVTPSAHLIGLTQEVDVAIVRHTDERSAAEFLTLLRPRLAVLASDGVPASVAGIREMYRGALRILPPRPNRVDLSSANVQPRSAAGGRP